MGRKASIRRSVENIEKGVFIAISKFTKEATSCFRTLSKHIKLIDRELLADLVFKYHVGINVVQKLTLHKVDSDYYEE